MTTAEFYTVATAVYAAVVSTIVLAWDVVKWRMQGPRLRVSITRAYFIGGSDSNWYVGVEVANFGDRPTTLSNIRVSVHHRGLGWRGKERYSLALLDLPYTQSLPIVLAPGETWKAKLPPAGLEQHASSGQLAVCISHSHSPQPVRKNLVM
jgi:hypothetical protein